MKWQPIETAPKDDKRILAYCPHDIKFPEGRIMIWSGKMLATASSGPNHLQFPAAHWMPLPDPPTQDPNT